MHVGMPKPRIILATMYIATVQRSMWLVYIMQGFSTTVSSEYPAVGLKSSCLSGVCRQGKVVPTHHAVRSPGSTPR